MNQSVRYRAAATESTPLAPAADLATILVVIIIFWCKRGTPGHNRFG